MRRSNYYVLVGDHATWEVSLQNKIWGFSEHTRGYWKRTEKGDLLAFYVTFPTKKVIGFGRINEKFKDDEVLWPDEKIFGKVIWPYRLKFDILYLLANWQMGIPVPKEIMLNTGRKLIEKAKFISLVKKADYRWGSMVYSKIVR